MGVKNYGDGLGEGLGLGVLFVFLMFVVMAAVSGLVTEPKAFREGACAQVGGTINGELCIKDDKVVKVVQP